MDIFKLKPKHEVVEVEKRNALKGVTRLEETRAKISAAWAKRKAEKMVDSTP